MSDRAAMRARYAERNALQRLQARVKLTCCIGVLHTLVMAVFAYLYAQANLPWLFPAAISLLLLLMSIGVWFRMSTAGIGFVAIAALNLVLQAIDGRWSGVAIGALFVLAYVDGMRSLFQLHKLQDASPPPPGA